MLNHRFFGLNSLIIAFFLFSASQVSAQRQWTEVTSYPGMNGIQFPTEDTGYAILNDDSLIRTTDGGQTWNGVNLPYISPLIYGSNNLTFFGSYGWITIHEDTNGQPARLLHSSDYGFTWAVLPMDSSWIPTEIYFKSPSLGYLWWNNVFYISTDSGKSWEQRNAPPSGGDGGLVLSIGQPNEVMGKSVSQAFFIPTLSTDTGATWHSYSGPLMSYTSLGPGAPVYIGANTWITYDTWTSNNGQTWDTAQSTEEFMFGVMITDTLGHGMFAGRDSAGHDSILYFTTNFGHSWDSAKVPFKEIQQGVIVGAAWYVLAPDSGTGTLLLYSSTTAPARVTQSIESNQFQILTNPATHFLQISLEDVPDEICIVDFLGRTVARYSTQGGEFSADVSGLPEGLYWVVARSGAKPFVHLSQ